MIASAKPETAHDPDSGSADAAREGGRDAAREEVPGSELRSFGRRRGRKLSPRQTRLLDDILPRVQVDLSQPAPQPLRDLFGSDAGLGGPGHVPRQVWLEIGFGGAEHLVWQAEHHTDVGLIGCEPFEEGVVKALAAIEDKGLGNVRLHADDARPLLRWLPEASIERAFVLFPDPWPKKKHVKRRLVNPVLFRLLARALAPGAELRIATDIGDYARTILIALQGQEAFTWTAHHAGDWRQRPADWPATRYEQKALREGRRPAFFTFVRR